jgi:U3 small nucleolar ribonucleoprotein protein IMP4
VLWHSLIALLKLAFVAVVQCGPRFELKVYQIRLGTTDQTHAENEWVLRSYTRNAKKAKLAEEES